MDKPEATGVTPVRDRRALSELAPPKRRRRYRLEEKQTILKAAAEPGSTVSEVSRQYGVGRSLIHNWRRQEAVAVLGATVRFTPVTVAPERRPGGAIEIELDGGVQVRVDAAVDEEALKRVLRALGR
ncbi:MAG: transposase [Planctomycetota bacterium]